MPNCEYYQALCSASLDGELTRAQKRELDAHLATCPACADYLEDLKFIRTAWGDLKAPLPDTLHEKIMAPILEEAQKNLKPLEKKKRRPPVFTMLAAAAACVILVLSGAVGDLLGGMEVNGKPAALSEDTGAAMEETTRAMPPPASSEAGESIPPSTLVPAQQAQPEPEPEDPAETDSAPASGNEQAPADASEDYGGAAASSSGSSGGTANAWASSESTGSAASGSEQADSSAASSSVANTPDVKIAPASFNRAEKQSVTLPENLQAFQFALCYVAVGTEDPPVLIDASLIEKIDNTYYFSLSNSMSSISQNIEALQAAGYETAVRRDVGVTLTDGAESILLILVVEAS